MLHIYLDLQPWKNLLRNLEAQFCQVWLFITENICYAFGKVIFDFLNSFFSVFIFLVKLIISPGHARAPNNFILKKKKNSSRIALIPLLLEGTIYSNNLNYFMQISILACNNRTKRKCSYFKMMEPSIEELSVELYFLTSQSWQDLMKLSGQKLPEWRMNRPNSCFKKATR